MKKIIAKSILRKHKKIDSWFLSRYGLGLYRGCAHNCVYCDGRHEKYQVDGEFGEEIAYKENAIALLQKELNPAKKRNPFAGGFFMLGSGVSDSYQPLEAELQLTLQALKIIIQYRHPLHILTRSTLVERDLDLLNELKQHAKVLVSMSFSSCNDHISSIFEHGVPPPSLRLQTLKKIKESGMFTGMYLMPVIPHITDSEAMIGESLQMAKNAGVDFVMFGGMTLKPGRQQDYFFEKLKNTQSDLIPAYRDLYRFNEQWGNTTWENCNKINNMFHRLAKDLKLFQRIPPYIFKEMLSTNNFVVVMLEHSDYLARINTIKRPYGYVAYQISQLPGVIETIKDKLTEIKGIGEYTAKTIREIIETGGCKYYEKLMFNE